MIFKAYKRPHLVGWLGWFEDDDGNVVGFLGFDSHFMWHKVEATLGEEEDGTSQ